MKLVIITGIVAFSDNIKDFLKKAEVAAYSFQSVSGYRQDSEKISSANWFASGENETESVLFYAFTEEKNCERLFNSISTFNRKQETLSHIHIAVLPIEKTN